MWPLRSSRQRFVGALWRARSVTMSDGKSDKRRSGSDYGRSIRSRELLCSGHSYEWHIEKVKPHGRLGPLRLETLARCPRAAYRRGGLPRPFRRVKPSGEFILGRASHLDAFSGYHSQSSLPGVAAGATAGTRADCPTRSSRTRVRTPQPSNAHSGYRPNCLTTF